jgi:hypothetical protein
MMGWFYLSVDSGTWAFFLDLTDNANLGAYAGVGSDGNTIDLWTNADHAGTALSTGTWYHVAVVCDAGANGFKLYLNGVQDVQTTGVTYTPAAFYIGNDEIPEPWNGRAAGVKVWNRVLTVAEIQQEMRQYVPVNPASIWGFYPLLSHLDATADYSGNGNTLTVGGTLATEDGPPIPWKQGRSRLVYIPAAGGAFTLTADGGSYTLTGSSAGVRATRKIVAAPGSYAVTGAAAALRAARKVVAGAGSYAVTGTAATLIKGIRMVAGAGSYAITGAAAALRATRKLVADSGIYAITGASASLSYSQPFVATVILERRVKFQALESLDTTHTPTLSGRSTFDASVDLQGEIE